MPRSQDAPARQGRRRRAWTSLTLALMAAAAFSAALITGAPSRAAAAAAGGVPAGPRKAGRVAAGGAPVVAPVGPVRGGSPMAGLHGYWLSSAFLRRSAGQAGARTAAAHSRILVATHRVHPSVTTRTTRPAATSPQPGRPLGTFLVTCYDLTGITASGAPVGPGAVAVDPSVIPLGTHMYVQGAGNRIALDTGGAIRGRHLDIWAPSYTQCVDWGAQQRPVWLEG